jgi:hypothetical protein
MKLGIDYGGTITAAPEFFAVLAKAMLAADHEVHIVTASPSKRHVESKLLALGIPYTEIWVPGNCTVSVSEWKMETSRKIGLTILIDDDPANLAGSSKRALGLRVYDGHE